MTKNEIIEVNSLLQLDIQQLKKANAVLNKANSQLLTTSEAVNLQNKQLTEQNRQLAKQFEQLTKVSQGVINYLTEREA
jgi:FtsZ-binding cell division protein ZapB